MFDFLKMGVSGELTYFAAFLSFVRMRPENATGRPARSRIVNMSRPPKRLYQRVNPSRGGSSTPASASSSSLNLCFSAHLCSGASPLGA